MQACSQGGSATPLDSDSDGWTDAQEQTAGTNPYNQDTDADGYWDAEDPNPLDPDIPTSAITAPPATPMPTTTDRGVEEPLLTIEGLPIKEELSPTEAENYIQLDDNRVQCQLCPNQCLLEDGERSTCRARQNIKGKLYTLTYGQPCALSIDPVERAPYST